MWAVYSVFPAKQCDSTNPILLKQNDGTLATTKVLLSFEIVGKKHTIWLEPDKRKPLLDGLQDWLKQTTGIPFKEFEIMVAKLQHAFTARTTGKILLTPCNCVLRKRPDTMYLHHNKTIWQALHDMHMLLWESVKLPIKCVQLLL